MTREEANTLLTYIEVIRGKYGCGACQEATNNLQIFVENNVDEE